MSYAAECMGRKDASPSDGCPDCLLITSERNQKVGLVDIPAPGQSTRLVVDHWTLMDLVPVVWAGPRAQGMNDCKERGIGMSQLAGRARLAKA